MLFTSKLLPIRSVLSRLLSNMAKQVIDDSKFTSIRLPTTIKPVHYDLSLRPNFNDFTFAGTVKISYQTGGDLPKDIVVHANQIKISDGTLEGDSKSNPLTAVTYSPTTETATLQFQDDIVPEGVINLSFTGILNDQMKGFYRTAFKIDDTEVYAGTTQFESTDARRCFPCWDEPAIKATFSVTMIVDKFLKVKDKQYERLVLSNMPEISRSGPDSAMEVKFDKTPIMSTYLLAFIVGPFEYIEGSDDTRPIRVFTTPGKKEQGRFALEVACKSLPYYEDYFGIKYPLPKMDLVAIPDFMSGAMENWGLVTYRETCLLFDPAYTSTDRKQYIAIVVAHELAHQWFGNLVTMEWWTHLWLNEGFATFMEYLCVDHIYPEYDVWSQFVTDAFAPALRLDALHNSHPIEVPVGRSSEVEEIFDNISYLKGASVIRMLYSYIGDDSFRKGMKDYLTKFAYKNAQTEDLWDCLEAASNKPVRKLMSGWTSQKGYPWLSLDYSSVEGDKAKLTISQNKFSADGVVPEGDEKSWMVPIKYVTQDKPTEPRDLCLLEEKSQEVTLDGVGDNWVKLNPGTIGLYRTAYPEAMAKKLFSAISSQALPPIDRLGVQNDFYALCQAGKVNSVELLKLLQAFKNETDDTVWTSIDASIGRMSMILTYTDYKDKFNAFVRDLYEQEFNRLGWVVKPNEKHTTAMTRAIIIGRLVSCGHEAAIQEAHKLYKAQLDGGAAIAADLRRVVYKAVSMYGDDDLFETLFNLYRTSEMSEEKNRVLAALGSTKDLNRLKRVLDMGMSNEVRKQDKIFFFVAASVSNPMAFWEFFKEVSHTLIESYGSSHLLTSMVKTSSENFATEQMAKEVEHFFETVKFPGAERSIKQSAENIRLNAGWLARDSASMKDFLASF